MRKAIDLSGKVFGRLTVVERSGSDNFGNATWHCVCECGKEMTIRGFSLRIGDTRSCGCLLSESVTKRITKHGQTMSNKQSPEYASWSSMKQRCNNPKDAEYVNYGSRGIKVCKAWEDSFEEFYKDMGKCPPKYTIERIENNGNYEPSNCKWASKFDQAKNQRVRKASKTGITGIHWDKRRKKFNVSIGFEGKKMQLSGFNSIEEAKLVRKSLELKYWGKSS